MKLYEIELEFIKIFMLGIFFGWQSRKYLLGGGKIPWHTINNVRFIFMNKKHK